LARTPYLSAREAALFARGAAGRVFLAGSAGEPTAILDAVGQEPDLWQNVTLTGPFIPGVNDQDYSALGIGTTVEAIFATPGLMAPQGTCRLLPMHYPAYWRRLAVPGHVSLAYVTVPPPRADGSVGLGLAADFAPAVIEAGARLVGIVNAAMPDVANGPRYPADRFAALVDSDAPLPIYDPGVPDAATRKIAELVVGLLRPGDTLQLGLGKVQRAVLEVLSSSDLRGLAMWSGMISTPVLEAIANGAVAVPLTTGVASGSADFYQALRELAGLRFRPVNETHDHARLAAIPAFVSVNSVVEVDLMGQANAEWMNRRQVSGPGGLVDFLRGARASSGGRAILALPSTAKGGTVSRIVARLAPGTPVSVSRAETQIIVTEHGIADMEGATAWQRAERLIAIAAPQHRDSLAAELAQLERTER
jgi:acyl-CoA hydrolase